MREDATNKLVERPPLELSFCTITIKISRRIMARALATGVSVAILAGITAPVFLFVPGVADIIVTLKNDHPKVFYIGVGVGIFNTGCAVAWAAITLWREIESEIDGTEDARDTNQRP